MQQIVDIARKTPGIKHVTGITGQSFVLNAFGSNFGSMFVNLERYAERRDPARSSRGDRRRICGQSSDKIQEAQVVVFGPPPVRGVGRAGGFTMMVEDRGDVGPQILQTETENLVRAGNQDPGPGRPVHDVPRQRAADPRRARRARVHGQGRHAAGLRRHAGRFTKARSTSTTSICSAARGR